MTFCTKFPQHQGAFVADDEAGSPHNDCTHTVALVESGNEMGAGLHSGQLTGKLGLVKQTDGRRGVG